MSSEGLVGQTIDGKYRIDGFVGQGGMGAVYTGTHLQLERPVAVKTLRPEFVADRAAMSRFAREARAAARIDHPNAVSVYDYGELPDGGAYLVMELVEGVSLRHRMRESGLLPLDQVVDLIAQVAAALDAAHAKGIVHRDIKPENVMLRAAAGGSQVKVVDFGLAKLISGENSTQLSRQSELMGTPKYMAPEQFGSDPVDERVDVYALGVMAYELIAGRAPFEGNFSEIIGKHIYAPVPPFAAAGVDVPEPVEEAVARALAKSPAERTPSAAVFARELAEAVDVSSGPFAPPRRGASGRGRTTPVAPTVEWQDPDDEATRPFDGSEDPARTVAGPSARPTPAGSRDDNATRYGDARADEATRARPASPTTGARGARPTAAAGALETGAQRAAAVPPTRHVPAPPRGHGWRAPAAAALAGAVVVGAAVYFATAPAPTGPPATERAPAPQRTPDATPPATVAAPGPAPAAPATPSVGPAAGVTSVAPAPAPTPTPPPVPMRRNAEPADNQADEPDPRAGEPDVDVIPDPGELARQAAEARREAIEKAVWAKMLRRLTPQERRAFEADVRSGSSPQEAFSRIQERRAQVRERRRHPDAPPN